MATPTLYVRDFASVPDKYVTTEMTYDNGQIIDWQAPRCQRCDNRFREHDWVLYVDARGKEAALDCSRSPR